MNDRFLKKGSNTSMVSIIRRPSILSFYRFFLAFGILENILASLYLFSLPTKTSSVFLAGFSLNRISAGFVIFFVLAVYFFFLFDSFRSQKYLKILTSRIRIILDFDVFHIIIRVTIVIILVFSLAGILFFLFPGFQDFCFQHFLSFLPNKYMFANLGTLRAILIGWVFLVDLKIFILDALSDIKASRSLSIPARLMVVSWTTGFFLFMFFALWSLKVHKPTLGILEGPGIKILILAVWFSLWALLNNRFRIWADRLFHPFVCISIGIFFYLVSMQFSQGYHVWGPNLNDNFVLLAYSFLHGKLYLLLKPIVTRDLIFHNQHWFIAFPPFPVILMLPFVATWGVKAFNITAFSAVLAALAVITMYLILNQLIRLGWIKLSWSGSIWLTALFAFGTVYWWLSIVGTTGFLSQVVTVLFYGLAFLSVLKKYPAWVAGICLAMAIMSRPNVFVLWPALVAIAIQHDLNQGKVDWRKAIKWGALSAIPVILGVGLLLYYNFLRFGNFYDFGYTTLVGAKWIIENVDKHGVFSLHYVPFNLYSMFLALPKLTAQCGYFLPIGYGMSMLMTTPALVFLVRKTKISWWTAGCWCSILLSMAELAMYSNNGANQYGYRYLMDFIIPVIMIIALNAGEKISGFLKAFILVSIIINYYGNISWLLSPCVMSFK